MSYSDAGAAVTVDLASGSALSAEGNDVLVGFERVLGSQFADNLSGNGSANLIDGGTGNDTIDSGAGDDVVNGGAGDDTLSGNEGNDVINGGDGNDTVSYAYLTGGRSIFVNLAAGTASGLNEDDILNGVESAIGSAGDDLMTGDAGNNQLSGGDGNDTINGGAGNDTISGGNGADMINGGSGNDNIDGGAGNDTFVIEFGSKTVAGGAGLDSFQFVQADFGTVTITDFEDGTEKLDFSSIANTVYSASHLDIQQIGANVQIRFVDPITHTALADTVLLQGENAASITRDDMIFRTKTIVGTAGNDHLVGGAGDDLILGLGGDDSLDGAAGSDTLDGGAGNDTALFNVTSDVTVDLGTGLAHVGADIDTLISIENVSTGGGNDQITGNADDNVLNGGAGNDTLLGGDGNDTLYGGTGTNVLNGGAGVNAVSYADSERAVFADLTHSITTLRFAESDPAFALHDVLQNINTVIASNFNDRILGNSQSNILIGGDGDDFIDGFGGNDVMWGGKGSDVLKGGRFDDTYLISEDDLSDQIIEPDGLRADQTGDDTVRILSVGDRVGTTVSYTAPLNTEQLIYEGNGNFIGSGYAVTGSSGNDILNGAYSAYGGAGDDVLAGQFYGGSNDGGAGFDYIDFGIVPMPSPTGWTVNLASGISSNESALIDGHMVNIEGVRGSNGDDILLGDDNANVLDGRGGNDAINGGGGDDTLIGGTGSNNLAGGMGNDNLIAGTGNDALTGDAGNDLFVFTPGAGSNDIIQDFHTAKPGVAEFDRIDLTAYGHGAVIDMRVDNAGTGTIVTVGGAGHIDSFTVLGVDPASLHQSDFILA